MVLKEPYASLILTVLPVYLIKMRRNGLERNPRSSPFADVKAVSSKNG